MNFKIDKWILYFGIASLLALSFFLISKSSTQTAKKEDEFIESRINGVIIKIEDQYRGRYALMIRQSMKGDTLTFPLLIGKFLRENEIQVGDSISKEANSHIALFYKLKEGHGYDNALEFIYY